jgi:monoamine oxidase
MSKHQVIIIGGGVSGLTAASDLIKNGIKDIVILEAQDHLGGRIFTTPLDSIFAIFMTFKHSQIKLLASSTEQSHRAWCSMDPRRKA